MSGPKKADVEAQLNIARRSQRNCEGMISHVEDLAIGSLIKDVEGIMKGIKKAEGEIRTSLNGLSDEIKRVIPEGVHSVSHAFEIACNNNKEAEETLSLARETLDNARRIEESAKQVFESAEREYDRAYSALRHAGGHYMHDEMRWAHNAKSLYDRAALELSEAAKKRKEAEKTVQKALQRSNQSRAEMDSIKHQIKSIRNEAQARIKAEEEARRIQEQKKREAVIDIEHAHASIIRISELPHEKFHPGAVEKLLNRIEESKNKLNESRFDEAKNIADALRTEIDKVEQAIKIAIIEYERKRAESEGQIRGLEATLSSIEETLIKEWSNRPDAVDEARKSLDDARESLSVEDIEGAGNIAKEAKEALAEALRTAAENKSADERRMKIGEAIMSTLHELNFDVSYEPGSRTEPMRITGQSSEATGRGDFDISIPLDGEVDFEVKTPEGDTTCISAIQSLQKRLEGKGVVWKTTNWGHAEGIEPLEERKVSQTVKEQVKVKRK